LTVLPSSFSRARLPRVPSRREHLSLDLLAFSYDDDIHVGRTVGFGA
jgi:hypothetical protein